jgi:hypothetical protein
VAAVSHADNTIQFKIKTVPGATAVTDGTIKLTAIYTMDPEGGATMTTPFYSSDCAVGSGVQPRANLGLCSVSGTYSPTTILLTADVIHMVKIPAGATVLDVILDADTNLDAGLRSP